MLPAIILSEGTMRVFLSYRRNDVGGYAGRLRDALVQRLGAKNVFQDVAAISPGKDFTVALDTALDAADAVLVMIGPAWLSAPTAGGDARLWQADDFVRLELARALTRDILVVPVLVGGASLPAAEELPPDLTPLARRQAAVLRDESWARDVDSLLRALRGPTEEPPSRIRRRAVLAAAVAVAVLAIAALWPRPAGNGDTDDQETSGILACESAVGQAWNELDVGDLATGTVRQEEGELNFSVDGARWRELEPGVWRVMLDVAMGSTTPDGAYHDYWRYDALIVGGRAFAPVCFSPDPSFVLPDTIGDARMGFDVRCPPEGFIELVLQEDHARVSVTDADREPSAC